MSSGFAAMSTNTARSPLPQSAIVRIDNGHSTELVVRVRPVANARCYEVRAAALDAGGTPGVWQPCGLFTSSRAIRVKGLTPGTIYTFQVRAVGGATGSSDWSDAVSHLCM